MIQNDQAVALNVGDIALVDSARPVTYLSAETPGQWLALRFPRKSLVSHLGSEPGGGSRRRDGMLAGSLLFNLVMHAANNPAPSPTDSEIYMHLAIYNLVGALFACSDPWSASHTDKVFARVCGIIKTRFSDPELGPVEVADEVGISLRYLQKIFAVRGSTCSHFIQSLRLDHAARLLHQRRSQKRPPLSEIAHASGFLDYNNFSRVFRQRFGYPPSSAGDRNPPADLEHARDGIEKLQD
jgi:AraC family transcriptional activator of tynA and feaB